MHAVRAFNCTSEFEMLENLDNLLQNKASIPILRSLTLSNGHNSGADDNMTSIVQSGGNLICHTHTKIYIGLEMKFSTSLH